jgi:phosphoglycerate dehydrogenase-like enzyme
MPVTVAMYDKSHEHIAARLDALKLDIEVLPFGKDGQFHLGGQTVPPSEVDVDYFWLSNHVNFDRAGKTAFDVVLNCKSVDVMQTFNAGLDAPVYKQISDKGTRICNSSAQAVAISEYTFAHVMSLIHPIELGKELRASKTWKMIPFREIWTTRWLIVGYGPIGQELSKRLKAFGAKVDVIRRSVQESEYIDRIGTMGDLQKFIPEADVIVLACALNAETRDMVDDRFLANVKKGAILVNIGRGPLVVDKALFAALDDGRLDAAVIDVFREEPLPTDDPMWTHPKIRFTPHTSFAGSGGRARWDTLFLDNIQRYVKGEPLAMLFDPKNFP